MFSGKKALRIATGCTADTNAQHLYKERKILPLKEHLKLHATRYIHKCQHNTHPLHKLTQQIDPPRDMKRTIFQPNNTYTSLQLSNHRRHRRHNQATSQIHSHPHSQHLHINNKNTQQNHQPNNIRHQQGRTDSSQEKQEH